MLGVRFWAVGGLLLLLAGLSSPASAQDDRPTAALMRTATEDEGLRGALDRIARSSLDDLEVAEVTGTLALDLEQAQLALGCMAVSAECLGTVAEENDVALLLAPRLDDTGDERVLTIVLYDERSGSVTQATRRIASGEGNDAILDSVPGLLRELFGLPLEEEAEPELDGVEDDPEPEGEVDEPSASDEAPPPSGGLGPGGPILLGVGGAALVGGVVAGVLFESADDDWSAATVGSDPAAAREAADLRSQAETRGRAATALFIAGGVLAAGGLVWLLVDLLGGDSDDGVAFVPHFGVGRGDVTAGLSMELSL